MPKSLTKSRLEALLSMATGAAAEVPAGLAGLYGAATGGSAEGVRMIDKVRGKLTYQPRDPRGQQEIARALGPIMQKIEAGKSALGDGAFNATGSPVAAAAAYTAPEALLSLLGARPALAAGRSASKGLGALVQRSAGLPAPSMGSPAAQLGIFAGKGAKTADLNAMAMAQSRLGMGADPRAVWRDTGWMKGPDGKMRFEIDDSRSYTDVAAAIEDAKASGRDLSKSPMSLDGVYGHDALYAAYPDAADIDFRVFPDARMRGANAAYSEKHNAMTVTDSMADPRYRSWIGHEMQHAVQGREDFARGGSPKDFPAYEPTPDDYTLLNLDRLAQENPDLPRAEIAQMMGAPEHIVQTAGRWTDGGHWDSNLADIRNRLSAPSGLDAYQRLAGEAEARAVQKRLDYTPQQRRDIYPLDDYDVPLDELILRGRR